MTCESLTITGTRAAGEFYRWRIKCSCGWTQTVPAVVTAAVVWSQHVKEAA